MQVRRLGERSSNITHDYKNSSIENNFLIKFQNFCRKHFLVTLQILRYSWFGENSRMYPIEEWEVQEKAGKINERSVQRSEAREV